MHRWPLSNSCCESNVCLELREWLVPFPLGCWVDRVDHLELKDEKQEMLPDTGQKEHLPLMQASSILWGMTAARHVCVCQSVKALLATYLSFVFANVCIRISYFNFLSEETGSHISHTQNWWNLYLVEPDGKGAPIPKTLWPAWSGSSAVGAAAQDTADGRDILDWFCTPLRMSTH